MASSHPLEETSLWNPTRKKPKKQESNTGYFRLKIWNHLPQVDLPASATRIDNPTQKKPTNPKTTAAAIKQIFARDTKLDAV